MSNEIDNIIKKVQYKTGKSLDDIAKDIGYSRPHLSKEKKKGDNEHLLQVLKTKYYNILQEVPQETSGTVPAKDLIQVLKDQNEFLRRNFELSLISIVEGQQQNGIQLKALTWYSALVANKGDQAKADQDILKIHNRIAAYEGVGDEEDISPQGGKRRTSSKQKT
jgi:hypothetical protein